MFSNMETYILANMENDMAPDPDEARASLEALSRDRELLASRIVTPWWYHPAVAAALVVLVYATAAAGWVATWAIWVFIGSMGAMLSLPLIYARRYGVAISRPAGRRSRRMLAVLVTVAAACMAGALVIRLAGLPLVTALIPMTIAAAGTIVLGRAYDAALRRDLTEAARDER
jgi:hypothetical protein